MSTEPASPPSASPSTGSTGRHSSPHDHDHDRTDRRARAWIDVDASALRANFRRVREGLRAGAASSRPEVGLIAMVKADGYGLGALDTVRCLVPEGPVGWGVATVDEGVELLGLGPREPIQVFSPMPASEIARALAAGLRVSLSDASDLDAVPASIDGSFDVEIDTGMGRAGLPGLSVDGIEGHALRILDRIRGGGLRWHGVFTHVHSADHPDPIHARAATLDQVECFRAAAELIDDLRGREGLPPLRRHVANSAAALRFPDLVGVFDAVRPGIALYGGTVARDDGLRDVATVRARVVRVADVPAGATAGYGATWRASAPSRWATVAIGYGDGLPRALSNVGEVLLHGHRAPIIGRISMDMTVVDVTRVPDAAPGDIAVIVGSDGGERISLDAVAARAGTIHYEILTGWSPRLPRVWTDVGAQPAGAMP